MRNRLVPNGLVLAIALTAIATLPAGSAPASDETEFKALKAEFDKAAKNHDDIGNRARRRLTLQMFDYLDQKACRKLLRDIYDDETIVDNRVAAVQVLGASGDSKDLDYLLAAFKKERALAPVIALGQGLGYTSGVAVTGTAQHAASLLSKQKGDAQRSLLEAIAVLGDGIAYAPVLALGDKLPPTEAFERLIALGACGRATAVPLLAKASKTGPDDLRLGATLGLARAAVPEAGPPLVELLADLDPRIVIAAADALGELKFDGAKVGLIDALGNTSIRVKESARRALIALGMTDCGYSAEAWKAGTAGTMPPAPPSFFGTPVHSNRVVIVIDLSRSMDWNGRLTRAKDEAKALIAALPDDALFCVVGAGRTPDAMAQHLSVGPDAKAQATTFVDKLLTSRSCDLYEAVQVAFTTLRAADTLLIATDSYPYGDSNDDTPLAVIQEIRKANRIRRATIHVAFVAPGGRYAESEIDADEYDDRKLILRQFAEGTGGKFVPVE